MLSDNEMIQSIKKILIKIADISFLYYTFSTILLIEIFYQTMMYDKDISMWYIIFWIIWKIYRVRHGYKSFSFKVIKGFFTSKPSKSSKPANNNINSTKMTIESKGYSVRDK